MENLKRGYSSADILDETNALTYIIKSQIENCVNTIEIVKVLEVNGDYVTVIPVIKNINASGNPIEETPIYNVFCIKVQGGLNCVKVSPEVGDIGILLISKRDTSNIIGGVASTNRKFNIADGIYFGGINGLNREPTQYLEIKDGEINIIGTTTINVEAPTINIKSTTELNLGNIGGLPIARDGDSVMAGSTVIGTISASSTKVKSV